MNSIQFNTENARAWHEGRKTQHRELMEPQPYNRWNYLGFNGQAAFFCCGEHRRNESCVSDREINSKYKVGEKVFIQEPWARSLVGGTIFYEISFDGNSLDVKWRDPKTMPQPASRSTAIITDIRVEKDDEDWSWVYGLKKGG